jgi:hypothetical protein
MRITGYLLDRAAVVTWFFVDVGRAMTDGDLTAIQIVIFVRLALVRFERRRLDAICSLFSTAFFFFIFWIQEDRTQRDSGLLFNTKNTNI